MTTPAPGTRRRVLFVEDEVALHGAYGRYFRERYELAFATTGAEALERFAAFDPQVLVIDLHLPDTDGIDVVRQLRKAAPGLAVVITSGYASMLPIVEMLGIAHSGYLVKPFDLETLRACIDAAR
jgi:DNA-binding response OmpR family regulator